MAFDLQLHFSAHFSEPNRMQLPITTYMIGTWFGSQNIDFISGPFLQIHFLGRTDFHCTILSPDISLRRPSRVFWCASVIMFHSGNSLLLNSRGSMTRSRGIAPARRRARSSLSGVSKNSPFLDQRTLDQSGGVRHGYRVTWIRLHSRGVLVAERHQDLKIGVSSQGGPPV